MRKGFSLMEMLVVIGIIAILTGVSLAGFSQFTKRAQKARAEELVQNTKVALTAVLQQNNGWPRPILAAGAGGNGEMTKEVGGALAKRGMMSFAFKAVEQDDGSTHYELAGNDRFGVITPWALTVVKRMGNSATESSSVPSGGTVADHRLRFSIDEDEDGITETDFGYGGKAARVRASACVWCYGMDGKPNTRDDIRSWTADQEVK